eukprot:5215948-Amphidinium_carterae.1
MLRLKTIVSGLVCLFWKGLWVCKGALNLLISIGAIPAVFDVQIVPSSLDMEVVALSHNLLEGPLPQRLFGGNKAPKRVLAVLADPLGVEREHCQRAARARALVSKQSLDVHVIQKNGSLSRGFCGVFSVVFRGWAMRIID